MLIWLLLLPLAAAAGLVVLGRDERRAYALTVLASIALFIVAVVGFLSFEAQRADPDSLLNRMRELIRIRKAHPVFGRGALHMLAAEPNAVLAYLRTSNDETMLVLNNLSSKPQMVRLDLPAYAGKTPVDVLTETHYPAVTADSYAIALDGYGYHWLKLT